jgi:hypothetical protein
MALKKEIILESGLPANYHRVILMKIVENGNVDCAVATYRSESYRRGGEVPLKEQLFQFPYSDLIQGQDILAQCYSKVKEALFSGAEDI